MSRKVTIQEISEWRYDNLEELKRTDDFRKFVVGNVTGELGVRAPVSSFCSRHELILQVHAVEMQHPDRVPVIVKKLAWRHESWFLEKCNATHLQLVWC